MLDVIKSAIPGPVKRELYSVKQKTYDQWYKKRLFKKMQIKHTELIEQIKGKQKIRVVFLAIHESVWKVDPVFKKMLEDPFFEPEILICPYTVYGEERMLEDMQQAYNYFISKGYPVRKAREEDGSWLKLSDIKPDIVFFTNPHNLTRKEYYEDAYLNYLSCYVPYHHEVVTNVEQFNQEFHVAQWTIFATHEVSREISRKICSTKGQNVDVIGYPIAENLLDKQRHYNIKDCWKNHDERVRIIWAPHHSIELSKNIPYSNFIAYAEFFKFLSENYKDKVVWSFKPHPLLKQKLYLHKNWGISKTDEYYEYWSSQEYSQLDEGEYIDLFRTSNAMIHDSGSFLAEYLYIQKPVLFLLSELNSGQHYSEFGQSALDSCEKAYSKQDIQKFIDNVILDTQIKKEHLTFLNKYISPYFVNQSPSGSILKKISEQLL